MNISILGCGWLGFPLAKHLVTRGHNVKGSTTSQEKLNRLEKNNIQPFLLKLTPQLENPNKVRSFWNSEILVLNIPPGRKRDNVIDFHTKQITSVKDALADFPIKFVIFVSSTSVYPELPGMVTEEDTIAGKAGRESGNALLKAEGILRVHSSFKTTVVRFGGLIGGDRHPVNYLAGKSGLGKASAPVNLIHLDDCIKIITKIVENKITGEVFNAVSDNHSTRKSYYTKAAKAKGLKPPKFKKDQRKDYKTVSNEKLQAKLGHTFTEI